MINTSCLLTIGQTEQTFHKQSNDPKEIYTSKTNINKYSKLI